MEEEKGAGGMVQGTHQVLSTMGAPDQFSWPHRRTELKTVRLNCRFLPIVALRRRSGSTQACRHETEIIGDGVAGCRGGHAHQTSWPPRREDVYHNKEQYCTEYLEQTSTQRI